MSGLLASAARSPSAASPFSSGAQATIPSIRGSSAETEVTQSASSRKSEKSESQAWASPVRCPDWEVNTVEPVKPRDRIAVIRGRD